MKHFQLVPDARGSGRLSVRRCAYTGAVWVGLLSGGWCLLFGTPMSTLFGGSAAPAAEASLRHVVFIVAYGGLAGLLAGALLALVYNAFEFVTRG